jgi:hypothetical protein
MRKNLFKILFTFNLIGFDLIKFLYFLGGLPYFFKTYKILKKENTKNKSFKFGKFYPILNDRFSAGGTVNGHYFHQDLLVAQKIFKNNPQKHIDVGSRIDGFVAHVATFREIEIFDIRPIRNYVTNIKFQQADLLYLTPNMHEICDSISALHSIEHFGLGRYGDPVDIDGHLKGIVNLSKMLKAGGKFYFSVPIGDQRIEFNAHRVFSIEYLLNILKETYLIDSFNYIDDNGDLHSDVILTEDGVRSNYNCSYGCGIFELTKK